MTLDENEKIHCVDPPTGLRKPHPGCRGTRHRQGVSLKDQAIPAGGMTGGLDAHGRSTRSMISITSSLKTRSMFSVASASRSLISTSLERGSMTVLTPARCAASSFSRIPFTGRMRPLRVSSPVMATSLRAGLPDSTESKDMAMVTPAEGPSLGIAPAGI